jgi:hypothetical protein
MKPFPMAFVRTVAAVALFFVAVGGAIFDVVHWQAMAPAVHWWSVPAFAGMAAAAVERFVGRDQPGSAAPPSTGLLIITTLVFLFAVVVAIWLRFTNLFAALFTADAIFDIALFGLSLLLLALPGVNKAVRS